jgi:hypothetical protein
VEPMTVEAPDGIWHVWFANPSFDFSTRTAYRGAWVLQNPSTGRNSLDTLSPPQTLNSLAGQIVGMVGQEAADLIWRHFNPTLERWDNGETHIEPNSWRRPTEWPQVLRASRVNQLAP